MLSLLCGFSIVRTDAVLGGELVHGLVSICPSSHGRVSHECAGHTRPVRREFGCANASGACIRSLGVIVVLYHRVPGTSLYPLFGKTGIANWSKEDGLPVSYSIVEMIPIYTSTNIRILLNTPILERQYLTRVVVWFLGKIECSFGLSSSLVASIHPSGSVSLVLCSNPLARQLDWILCGGV